MKIILVVACMATLASLTVAAPKTSSKADPLATPAATPMSPIQTVTTMFKPEEFAIEVQSTPETRAVKYKLAKNVRYVNADTGKAVDPRLIRPGTRVRLESKTKGAHGVYRRVVVIQPERA
jgi:hypothetical protein